MIMIISRSVLPRMRNVSDKSCRENRNAHFMFNNCFSTVVPLYEIMWENFVQTDRQPMTIWHIRIACWITKAEDTHSEDIIS
jgi:hypothetical protein